MASLNPFSNINLGASLGTFGAIALVIVIVVVILGLIGALIYWKHIKKQYWITIEVSRMIGGHPMKIATYSAREIAFGMAGDKLWRVAPFGFWKLKTVKWLPVGKLQSAPRVWKYWLREDGEWINYVDENLDEISKKMGIRFVQEDMRLQRLATERLLEQRLMNKSWWEKWGVMTVTIIVFLVVSVCMVIIFFQFGKLLDKFSQVEETQLQTAKILYRTFGDTYMGNILNDSGGTGLIPV